MINFLNIDYLKNGNEKQRKVFQVLKKHSVMKHLSNFDPILVGTIPIQIDIDSSDLDIICYWQNKSLFIETLISSFGNLENFKIEEMNLKDQLSIVCNFKLDEFQLEIFGQNLRTKKQDGYKHMVIEFKLLQMKGDRFKEQIIKFKKQGIKTEPAFAAILGLTGNPYSELLKLNWKKIITDKRLDSSEYKSS